MTDDSRIDSTDDSRAEVNNIMRHQYRPLSDAEKQHMQGLKDAGLAFIERLHEIGDTDPAQERQGSRELALAQTKIEEAVMWAVKHVTR